MSGRVKYARSPAMSRPRSYRFPAWLSGHVTGQAGALLTALLRSSPYWAMAKRAFFPSFSRDENFPWRFQVGLNELDMDVYWRSGHSDRFLLQIWCLERPFSRGYGCACLVWSSLIFLALWLWFCWSFVFRMERNMWSLPFCTTQLKC